MGVSNPGDLPVLSGISFVPIEDASIPWQAWGQVEEDSFSFMFDRIGDPNTSPRRLLVLLPGQPSEPCFLEESLREAAGSRATLLVQPLLESEDVLACGYEDPLIQVCRSLRKAFDIPPEKVFLVGEHQRSRSALTLASNHRLEFGGVIAWEGDPGAALPLNLTGTSIALLGNRTNLGNFAFFRKECEENSVPFKMNSYWGEVQSFELVEDLGEILNWMSSPEPRKIGRHIAHASYLPRYGRYGWIWITELIAPGLPGSLEGEWTRTALVRLQATGVKKFRVRLDSSFDRYGKRVFFSVGSLELPITLSRNLDAIEFAYLPEQDRWTARFLDFNEPIPPKTFPMEGATEFKKGDKIPGFASFTRIETGVECAWGNRFPSTFPAGEISDEDLYCGAPPDPYVRMDWTRRELEAFHSWQTGQPDLDLDISFAPGIRSNATEDPNLRVSCGIPFSAFQRYLQEQSTVLPEGVRILDNFQHLLGVYLSREHLASSSSL